MRLLSTIHQFGVFGTEVHYLTIITGMHLGVGYKKSDALVGRVSFHILQTSELALFPKIHRKYPKLQNLRIMLEKFIVKHVHEKFQISSFNTDGFRFFFDIFSRKFQNFSKELFSKFKKKSNLSI
jgi:hypothetical protein